MRIIKMYRVQRPMVEGYIFQDSRIGLQLAVSRGQRTKRLVYIGSDSMMASVLSTRRYFFFSFAIKFVEFVPIL